MYEYYSRLYYFCGVVSVSMTLVGQLHPDLSGYTFLSHENHTAHSHRAVICIYRFWREKHVRKREMRDMRHRGLE